MGKFKDRFNKLMRPNVSKPKESEDARAPVTASKSLTDSAEQEPASLSKAYRSASHSQSLPASMCVYITIAYALLCCRSQLHIHLSRALVQLITNRAGMLQGDISSCQQVRKHATSVGLQWGRLAVRACLACSPAGFWQSPGHCPAAQCNNNRQ